MNNNILHNDFIHFTNSQLHYILVIYIITIRFICHESVLLLRGIAKKDGKELPMDFNFVCSDIPRHFNRIGKYTFGHFTKKEKKKIEALTINKTMYQYTGDGTSNGGADYTAVYDNTKFQDKMIDKINELVDAVNKLMDKEDKE